MKIEWRYCDWNTKNKQIIIREKLEPFSQEEFDYYYNIAINAEVLRDDIDLNSMLAKEQLYRHVVHQYDTEPYIFYLSEQYGWGNGTCYQVTLLFSIQCGLTFVPLIATHTASHSKYKESIVYNSSVNFRPPTM